VRVSRFNQRNLLAPPESFQLLLAVDCLLDPIERLPIEQPFDVVFVSETSDAMKLMTEHATMQVAGHSDVECAREAA
jgi:hypothetical protein